MDQKTIKAYNQMAKEYDEETRDFWELFPATFQDRFKSLVLPGSSVLDVGSGPGRDGLKMKSWGLNVTCLDASPVMVKMCQDLGLVSVPGDFLDIAFESEKFDAVWAYTSLLHVPKSKISQALSEIRRVLKSGGILALGMIEGDKEEYRTSSGVAEPRFFAFYNKEELRRLATEAGFQELYFEEFTPRSKNYLNFIFKKI